MGALEARGASEAAKFPILDFSELEEPGPGQDESGLRSCKARPSRGDVSYWKVRAFGEVHRLGSVSDPEAKSLSSP